jgi:hypothetical protein
LSPDIICSFTVSFAGFWVATFPTSQIYLFIYLLIQRNECLISGFLISQIFKNNKLYAIRKKKEKKKLKLKLLQYMYFLEFTSALLHPCIYVFYKTEDGWKDGWTGKFCLLVRVGEILALGVKSDLT